MAEAQAPESSVGWAGRELGQEGVSSESSLGPSPSFLPHQKSAADTSQPLRGPRCFDWKPLGPVSVAMRALGDQSHVLPLLLQRVGTEP